MDYHEAMIRAIDIQSYIKALLEDFPELVSIEPDTIQIGWDAFAVLLHGDCSEHFTTEGYEHKRGFYNGVRVVTCREVKPDEA